MPEIDIKEGQTKGINPIRPLQMEKTKLTSIANPLLTEQQALGNQTMLRFAESCPLLLPSASLCPPGGACYTYQARIQTKLKMGQPRDKYDQEAKQVADEVMRITEPEAFKQLEKKE